MKAPIPNPDINSLPPCRIVCAAVRYIVAPSNEVYVFPGVRHFSPDMMAIILNYVKMGLMPSPNDKSVTETQGFLDAYSRFLTREEALIVAKEFNQILPDRVCAGSRYKLFSEDLY